MANWWNAKAGDGKSRIEVRAGGDERGALRSSAKRLPVPGDAHVGRINTWLTAKAEFASGVNRARRWRREIAGDSQAQVDKNRNNASTTRKWLSDLDLDAEG